MKSLRSQAIPPRLSFFRKILISGWMLYQILFLLPSAWAQVRFGEMNKEETRRDQQTLREQMQLQQEALREEMERVRIEIRRIMKHISLAMKEEAIKLKEELRELQKEASRINKEIADNLEKAKSDFSGGLNEMRKELENMRREAKSLKKEMAVILEEQRQTGKDILAQTKDAKDSPKKRQAHKKLNAGNTNRKILALAKKDRPNRGAKLRTRTHLKKARRHRTHLKRAKQPGQGKGFLGAGDLESYKDESPPMKKARRHRTHLERAKQPGQGKGFLGADLESCKDESPPIADEVRQPIDEKDPMTLAELKEKLYKFGSRIKTLKKQIEENSGNPSSNLIKLGNEYLGAQRFIDSQDDLEKLALLQFASEENLPLGSYEQAAWAFKMTLGFNANKGEAHLNIGKIYGEIQDGKNAAMYAKLARSAFRQNKNPKKMKEAQNFIESVTKKCGNRAS